MNDVRKYVYGTLLVLVFGALAFLGVIFYNACGFTTSCQSGVQAAERTPIPTLIPATLPAADRFVSAPVVVEATASVGSASGIARPLNRIAQFVICRKG
jgi:hypothetical protein